MEDQIEPNGITNPAISFRVNYRLGEYLRLLFSHLVAEVTRRKNEQGKRVSQLDLLILRISLWIFAPPIFIVKVHRIGACNFKIDDGGIVRSSKMADLVVPWEKVMNIYEYPEGYLIAKENGALPIPFRALADSQLDVLRNYVSRHRVNVSMNAGSWSAESAAKNGN